MAYTGVRSVRAVRDDTPVQRRSLGVAKEQKATVFCDRTLSERDDWAAREIDYPKLMKEISAGSLA